MKYSDFKNSVKALPFFSPTDLTNRSTGGQTIHVQVSGWKKRGLVLKLKKGLYMLNEHDRAIEPTRPFLANALCFPSYVSTSYAMAYYNLIPEKVTAVTSVTAKKTQRFENVFGNFIYQHVQPGLFFGFFEEKDENGYPIMLACPEKALLDFIYLNTKGVLNEEMLVHAYRFQNLNILKKGRWTEYTAKFNNRRVAESASAILDRMNNTT